VNACIAAHDKVGRFATMFTVDKLLAPPMGTVMDVLKADNRFSTLVGAIQRAGLTELLNKPGASTVFAPTNAAFQAMPSADLNKLMGNSQQLAAFLKQHMVEELLVSGGVNSHTRLKVMQGESLQLGIRNQTMYVNRVPVVDADLMATNGVVHALNAIIKPIPPKTETETTGSTTVTRTVVRTSSRVVRNDDLFQKIKRSRSSRAMARGQ